MHLYQHKTVKLFLILAIVCFLAGTVAIAADAPKVNINTATVKELTMLKRIGPKYAEKIIAYRDANGPFKKPEDLLKIPGIGEKTLEVNQGRILTK